MEYNSRSTEIDFSEKVITADEARKLAAIERQFLESYIASKDVMPIEEWLPKELSNQLPDRSFDDITAISTEIITSLSITEAKKESLQAATAKGRTRESWLAKSLMESTSQMSAQESAKYLQGLDHAVKEANQAMYDTITTRAGLPNQNYNLDGFIAEQHHVNSFNLKAQATGSDLHAEVLKPKPGETYKANSVDVVIKDSSGKIVRRYQMKYGKTAEDTIRMIKEGNYRGQRIVVPEEQVEAVKKAFPDRDVSAAIGDGNVKSPPMSKEEAKAKQEKAQSGDFLSTDWNEYSTKDIAVGIGKQAGYATLQGAVIGAGMNIATKVWNNEPVKGEEILESAISSGADFGVKVATAGALKTAVEKDIIKVIPKGTPGSTFSNIAFVAIENVKILGKMGAGDLTLREGIDAMQQTTASCIAGLAASTKGAALGAAVGTVLGPIGTAIGGFVGGTVGYMAGSTVGKVLVQAAQKVRDKAVSYIKSAANTVSRAKNKVRSFISGLASAFAF